MYGNQRPQQQNGVERALWQKNQRVDTPTITLTCSACGKKQSNHPGDFLSRQRLQANSTVLLI